MRIAAIRLEDGRSGPRAVAEVVWEGRRRTADTLWFETDAAFAPDFEAAPEAFLLATMPLAAGLGEPRLLLEGRACAGLAEHLRRAMRVFAAWYPWCREVPLEATGGFHALAPRSPPRAASFLSGGIDSLSLLRSNRLAHPAESPDAIRDGIFHFGWTARDFVGPTLDPQRLRAFEEQRARLDRLGAEIGLTVLPLRTNVRTLVPNYPFQRDVGWGPGMVAGAHLWRRRISRVWLASSGPVPAQMAHASRPDLDPHFSSSAVEVASGEPDTPRTAKVRRVAEWPAGLAALQVCVMHEVPPPGQVNCGRCEKCLRTMLALVVVGGLERATTFPRTTLSPRDLASLRVASEFQLWFAEQLAEELDEVGRHDLAAALRARRRAGRLREARRRLRRRVRRTWARLRGRALPPGPA